jgi:hypothetical protein
MDINWNYTINYNLSMRNNSVRKKIFYQIPVLLLILAISVPMVTAPVLSTILFSSTNAPVNQLAYATTEGDGGGDSGGGDSGGGDSGGGDSGGGDSGGGDSGGGDSGGGDQSSSSTTTTDPALASSTTTTDPALASSTTTTDPALGQSLLGLTFSTENASPPLVEETEEQDLDCGDISNKNFKVSSNDPNRFDGDNDGIGCESGDEDKNDENLGTSIGVTNEGPDRDCLFDPTLDKCANDNGECPDGFNNNAYDQCVPDHSEEGCPDGYHGVDDDETGRCIPDSDGCPEGMIFRSDGKTCGDKEQLCQQNSDLEGCAENPETCDPSYSNYCIKPSETDLDCNWDGNVKPDQIPDKNFPVGKSDPHRFDGNKNGIGCEKGDKDKKGIDFSDLDCKHIPHSIKVSSSDPNRFDRDKDGIGCENNGKGGNGNNNGNNDNDDNDNGNGNNDDAGSNNYIITPSNSCADISDTVDLSSEQIDPEDVRVIAFFDNCDLDSASLELNLVQNDDLKLVAANLDDGLSDAVEVEMNQVGQSESNSNILYEATITDNQEGQDLDTGETKTLNNVNGIVLWNDDEDEPIEFADNNFVEANINFFN